MITKKTKFFPSNELFHSSYTIRKATIDDYEKLKRIKLLSKKEELKYSETLKPLSKSKEYYEEYLQLDLTKPDRALFIAEENKKIVGIILGKFFKPLRISKYPKKGHISNLYVDKAHRKKGIAEKLVLEVIKWLKENRVRHSSLEIHIDNIAAQNLYRKLGFKDYTIKLIKEI